MSKVFFISIITSIFFSSVSARKPAVDPIMGISIEEYKEVPPEKAKGFDFSDKKVTNTLRAVTNKEVSKLKEESATTETSGTMSLLISLLIFLPIIASGMTFYLIKKNHRLEENDNVVDLVTHREKSNKAQEDKHGTDIPKAS